MFHDKFPAGVIITKGLGGSCETFILAHFHLFLGVEVEVRGPRFGGGTSLRPEVYYPPREDEDEVIWEPREDEEYEVIIKVDIGKKQIERHYFVRKRTQVVVTQVLHFLNTTRSRINVGVGTIRKTAKDVAIALRKLRKKP